MVGWNRIEFSLMFSKFRLGLLISKIWYLKFGSQTIGGREIFRI